MVRLVGALVWVVLVSSTLSAYARVREMNCKVLDERGNLVNALRPFAASPKGEIKSGYTLECEESGS